MSGEYLMLHRVLIPRGEVVAYITLEYGADVAEADMTTLGRFVLTVDGEPILFRLSRGGLKLQWYSKYLTLRGPCELILSATCEMGDPTKLYGRIAEIASLEIHS